MLSKRGKTSSSHTSVVCSSERSMDFDGERYYKINRILLEVLGLWPHRGMGRAQVQLIFFFTLFTSFMFFQLCTLVTSQFNVNLVIEVFSNFLPTLIYTIKYHIYYFKSQNVKLLMEEMGKDWKALDDKKEIEIIDKYAHTMNMCTVAFTLFTGVGLVIFIFIETNPIMLDVVAPLNQSRTRSLHVPVEYFVDFDQYFGFIVLHEILSVLGGAFTILATGTIVMAYAQHVCGMLKVVSFRIEHVLKKDTLRQQPTLLAERIICDRIVHAVQLHRRTLKFFDSIISTFATPFCILIIIGVASVSLNLYRMLQLLSMMDMLSLIPHFALLTVHFLYMFLANYVGQLITDHSVEIFYTTCNLLWYNAPLQSQKVLLFLMHRMIKHIRPVIGKLFVASLEGFGTLATTSLSYFTVIYSLR